MSPKRLAGFGGDHAQMKKQTRVNRAICETGSGE
jgi:hypothetical protein